MQLVGAVFWVSATVLSLFYMGYYAFCTRISGSKSLKIKKDKNFRPSVSVIIPTWNEEKSIEGKLKNTLSLDYPKKKLEVIVIDSGSTDRTREIVKKFKGVKLLTEKKRHSKAQALNKAFKHCSGDLVMVSDADCRLKEKILMKTVPYFNDQTIGAVTGRQIIPNSSESTTTRIEKNYRSYFYLLRDAESKMDSTFIFDGPFMMVRNSLLEEISGNSVADDSELALMVRKKGYRTLSLKEAGYIEYAPNVIKDRTKQKERRAQGIIQVMIRFFSTFFLNPSYGMFGMVVFPVEFFMHVISPFLLVTLVITMLFLPLQILALVAVGFILSLAIRKTRLFLLTFLHSQYSCLKGMMSYFFKGSMHSWDKIEGTRRYAR